MEEVSEELQWNTEIKIIVKIGKVDYFFYLKCRFRYINGISYSTELESLTLKSIVCTVVYFFSSLY